jgi:hypothetical protein
LPIILTVFIAIALYDGRADAQVGKRNFIEPLITQDANPGNSFDFLPQWLAVKNGTIVSLVFSLEKQLSENSSIELADAWNDPSCDQNSTCDQIGSTRRGRGRRRHLRNISTQVLTGFEDLEILLKYAILKSDRHELRLALGLDTFLPIGNPSAGGNTHTATGPMILVSKGMGDIPDDGFARYLRPFAIQADFEYLFQTGGSQTNEPAADWVISYEVPYLTQYVHDFGLPELIRGLVPFAEFTCDQVVKARYGGGPPDLRIMPGIAYMQDTYQVSVATQFALNQGTVHNAHAGVIVMLSLVLDQIWPVAGEAPL